MNDQELANLIQQHGATYMASVIRGGELMKQAEYGWNLTRWRVRGRRVRMPSPGRRYRDVLWFVQVKTIAEVVRLASDPRILVVYGPDTERSTWEAVAQSQEVPLTIIMQSAAPFVGSAQHTRLGVGGTTYPRRDVDLMDRGPVQASI